MLTFAIAVALASLSIAIALAAWRFWRGPSVADRVLALDTLYVFAVAAIVSLGVLLRESVFFEVALLIALMGFIGTVALARFVARGRIGD